nr:hypothetical protein CFP56_50419 [Quercus suber]
MHTFQRFIILRVGHGRDNWRFNNLATCKYVQCWPTAGKGQVMGAIDTCGGSAGPSPKTYCCRRPARMMQKLGEQTAVRCNDDGRGSDSGRRIFRSSDPRDEDEAAQRSSATEGRGFECARLDLD